MGGGLRECPCCLKPLSTFLFVAFLLLSLLSVFSSPGPPTCLFAFLTGLALNLTVALVIHSIKNELSSAQRS